MEVVLISKTLIVNFISIALIVLSYFVPQEFSKYLLYSGLFALSGAITNQIAIFMIFNKVPFIYGSGVIEENFDKFKASLKEMIMEQFFSKEQLDKFFEQEESKLELAPLVDKIDFNIAFDSLKEGIMESKFGQIINMFGGESSLELLRVTFNKKLSSSIKSILNSETFKKQLNYQIRHSSLSEDLTVKIDNLITSRLEMLGPKSVKELLDKLIKEHLEWLIVWGGVFGGLMGFISVLIF